MEPSDFPQTTDPNEAERLRNGGDEVFAELFSVHRDRLLKMIQFRLDPKLQRRLDSEDILQEAYLDAHQRIESFLSKPEMPFFLWLRMISMQTLINVHRRHVGAQMRDVSREVSLNASSNATDTSLSLQSKIMGSFSSPSQAAMRTERAALLQKALASMSELDREVLALRHFEELSNIETAETLSIQPQAASVRYFRAIRRLQTIFESFPGQSSLFS